MTIETILGWIAAGFTVAAFSVRTMYPLRLAAIGSNVFFILYGLAADMVPVAALHALLLPLNLIRLYELWKSVSSGASTQDDLINSMRPYLKPTNYRDGEVVFLKGEPADYLYAIETGAILIEEIDVTLGEGEVFGEIAFFTEAQTRTLTARAVGPCKVFRLSEDDFIRLHYLNPAFGLGVMRLATKRLMEGMQRHPFAYGGR